MSKDGERGDQWEERGAAVQQLRDRVLPRMEGEGAEGGECNCGQVEPPGMFQWGGGGKEGTKVFESNNGANELDERGQRGGGLLEAKKSKKWPFAVKLWHLPSARLGGRSEIVEPGRGVEASRRRFPTCICTRNRFPATRYSGASSPNVKGYFRNAKTNTWW